MPPCKNEQHTCCQFLPLQLLLRQHLQHQGGEGEDEAEDEGEEPCQHLLGEAEGEGETAVPLLHLELLCPCCTLSCCAPAG